MGRVTPFIPFEDGEQLVCVCCFGWRAPPLFPPAPKHERESKEAESLLVIGGDCGVIEASNSIGWVSIC